MIYHQIIHGLYSLVLLNFLIEKNPHFKSSHLKKFSSKISVFKENKVKLKTLS